MAYDITNLSSEADYRTLYESMYCDTTKPIFTFDGIRVKFFSDKFADAFFRSADWILKDKSIFSRDRAERITWIKDALLDNNADLRAGWDRDNKKIDNSRRVAIVKTNYVVVIRIQNSILAKFITAYIADNDALRQLLNMPTWIP